MSATSFLMSGSSGSPHESHGNVENLNCHNEEAPLFSSDELHQFVTDDTEAGRRIGKILSALFIYTLVAMSVAVWWTFKTVGH